MEAKTENSGTGSERAASGCFICETALPLLERCLGASTVGHFRASHIEFLKGVRSLIDERIATLSKESQHKGTHVTVE